MLVVFVRYWGINWKISKTPSLPVGIHILVEEQSILETNSNTQYNIIAGRKEIPT